MTSDVVDPERPWQPPGETPLEMQLLNYIYSLINDRSSLEWSIDGDNTSCELICTIDLYGKKLDLVISSSAVKVNEVCDEQVPSTDNLP